MMTKQIQKVLGLSVLSVAIIAASPSITNNQDGQKTICAGNTTRYYIDTGILPIVRGKPEVSDIQSMLAITKASEPNEVVGWLAIDRFANRFVELKMDADMQTKRAFPFVKMPRPGYSPFSIMPSKMPFPNLFRIWHCPRKD